MRRAAKEVGWGSEVKLVCQQPSGPLLSDSVGRLQPLQFLSGRTSVGIACSPWRA